MRFIFGTIIILLSLGLMRYTVYITDNVTGQLDWAEKIFGGGFTAGTYTWWRVCGLLGIIIAISWMFGWLSFGAKTQVPGAPKTTGSQGQFNP
jgi:uncharacterized membrane protein (DUF373 family)